MKHKLTMVIRVLFGLFFLVMGLNYFFGFITIPPMPIEGSTFMMALSNTGYMLPFNAGLQILAGLMLIFNLWAPLALLLLAPLILNIVLFHIYLDPAALGFAIVVAVIEFFLVVMYWDHFAHFFKKKISEKH